MDTTLRTARLAAGLTTRELAARAGTSHATIVAYEQGRKIPRSDTRQRLLDAAGWTTSPLPLRRISHEPEGRPRGEAFLEALELAEEFPARPPSPDHPAKPFPQRLHRDSSTSPPPL